MRWDATLLLLDLFDLACTCFHSSIPATHHRTPQHTTKHANHPSPLELVCKPPTRGKGIPRGICSLLNLSLLLYPKLTQTLEKLLISPSSWNIPHSPHPCIGALDLIAPICADGSRWPYDGRTRLFMLTVGNPILLRMRPCMQEVHSQAAKSSRSKTYQISVCDRLEGALRAPKVSPVSTFNNSSIRSSSK